MKDNKPKFNKNSSENKTRATKPQSARGQAKPKPKFDKDRTEKSTINKTKVVKTNTKNVDSLLPGEKLQKILARAGQGSRREIERTIAENRVSVDGKIAKLGDRVDINQSGLKIRVDGHVINLTSAIKELCRVLIYYKPEGELCTRSDPEGRATVFARLPVLKYSRWIAVGRLDINTSGLLLFTTDGELANRLMHPSQEIEREYSVRVFGQVDDAALTNLRKGVKLEDGYAKFNSIKAVGGQGINQWFNVVLTEGKNREVRRLWESQEIQVNRLIRIRYADIVLPKTLPRGGWQEMALTDINKLRALVHLPLETESYLDLSQKRRKLKAGQIRKAVSIHQHRKNIK